MIAIVNKEEKTKSPVSRRLREARIRAELSQKELGVLAGIDQFSASARINQYERDKHVPDFATVQRLAKVLKAPSTYLYADNDKLAEIILLFESASSRSQSKIKQLLLKK